ncbi:MAG TPA: integrase family protein, partial [Gammaproteobacteria bacterium]|nr:integrase family protein [Gammaproteobacteria bacterium]
MHLTKRTIEAITPPATGYAIHWDDATRGLGVRVTMGRAISFIYQRRINGRTRRLTIGPFPTLGVEAARRKVARLAGEIADGKDPVAEKRKRSAEGVTLQEALNGYLAARELKARTRRDVAEAMRSLADWRDKPVKALTPTMIEQRHRKLGKHSEARANLTMRYLRAILNYAAAEWADDNGEPLIAYNPVKRLGATKSWFRVERRRTLLKEHELKPWWQAVKALGDDPAMRHGAEYRDYLITLLLTGLRRTEALSLTWDAVDFKARTLTITDTKNREPHTLPLPAFLLELLT